MSVSMGLPQVEDLSAVEGPDVMHTLDEGSVLKDLVDVARGIGNAFG